jgi:hypothetical protein
MNVGASLWHFRNSEGLHLQVVLRYGMQSREQLFSPSRAARMRFEACGITSSMLPQ